MHNASTRRGVPNAFRGHDEYIRNAGIERGQAHINFYAHSVGDPPLLYTLGA